MKKTKKEIKQQIEKQKKELNRLKKLKNRGYMIPIMIGNAKMRIRYYTKQLNLVKEFTLQNGVQCRIYKTTKFFRVKTFHPSFGKTFRALADDYGRILNFKRAKLAEKYVRQFEKDSI